MSTRIIKQMDLSKLYCSAEKRREEFPSSTFSGVPGISVADIAGLKRSFKSASDDLVLRRNSQGRRSTASGCSVLSPESLSKIKSRLQSLDQPEYHELVSREVVAAESDARGTQSQWDVDSVQEELDEQRRYLEHKYAAGNCQNSTPSDQNYFEDFDFEGDI